MSPSPAPAFGSDLTLLLNARGTASDGAASDELLPLIYDELRQMAARQMASETREQTLQPTALVHEAWLRLGHRRARRWNDRMHFFRVAVRTMRRILVDRARHKSTLKHADDRRRVDLAGIDPVEAAPDDRILLVDAALHELKRLDPESARLVDLKFFGGFTNKEVAWMLGVSERTIERQWLYAKARIFQIMKNADR